MEKHEFADQFKRLERQYKIEAGDPEEFVKDYWEKFRYVLKADMTGAIDFVLENHKYKSFPKIADIYHALRETSKNAEKMGFNKLLDCVKRNTCGQCMKKPIFADCLCSACFIRNKGQELHDRFIEEKKKGMDRTEPIVKRLLEGMVITDGY